MAYLIGSFPTAYVVTRALTGVDLRKEGSRNVGGLNTYRVISKRKGKIAGLFAGSLVALVDASKPLVSYLISLHYDPTFAFLSPMAAIFGHNYPIWLRFRGGRGLASLLGIFFFLQPLAFLTFLIIQGSIFLFTRKFAPGAMLSLLTTLPLLSILGAFVPVSLVYSEFPVWLKYREKYLLMREGRLGVGM